MLLRRKFLVVVSLLGSIFLLGGCGGSFTLNPPNGKASSNPSRLISSTTLPGGGTATGSFSGAVALTYYLGTDSTAGASLQNISVSVGSTNSNQVLVSAPNVGTNTDICVITGASYTSCASGTFFQDIGEQVCNVIQNGSAVFTMDRSNFNWVTVVLYSDLQAYTAWWNGTAAQFPTVAQGQVAQDYATCN